MPQQHEQFEEFRDGPQPLNSFQSDYTSPQPPFGPYQGGYTGPQPISYITHVPPPSQSFINILPGQKLLIQDVGSKQPSGNLGRFMLALISLALVFAMFIVALAASGSEMGGIAFLFALVFAAIALVINIIYNRKH